MVYLPNTTVFLKVSQAVRCLNTKLLEMFLLLIFFFISAFKGKNKLPFPIGIKWYLIISYPTILPRTFTQPNGTFLLCNISNSIQKQNKNAVLVAIGGSIPEFIFCYIAIKASHLVLSLSYLFQYFQIALAIIFSIAGIYLWLNKTNVTNKITKYNGIVLGLSLAVLNPQLILFWTTVITYIQINNLLPITVFNDQISLFAFCLGSTLGAFILHVALIAFSRKFITIDMSKFFKYADKTTGTIFIILSIFQIIKLLT